MGEILNAIKLKNKITIAALMAVLAVILAVVIGILTFALADRHAHVYEYGLEMDEDGSFDLVGLCTVDNCESPYYREMDISGVKLFSAVSPTCSKAGNRVYTYSYKGTTLKYTEELPKADHLYEFEIVTRDEVTYINGRCQADGCEDPHIFVSNIEEIKKVSSVPGNCFTPRKDTYVYIVDGKEYSFSTLVDEDVPHTLNRLPANSYEDKDGKYAIGTEGIKLLSNEKIACGGTGNGYYVCELCKQVVVVKVLRPDHKFIYSEENVTAPGVTTTGLVTLACHNTECEEKKEVILPPVEVGIYAFVVSEATELHPQIVRYSYESTLYGFKFEKDYEIGEPLGHNYVYALDFGEVGQIDLVGTCKQPECQTPEIREKNVAATFEDTSTCLAPGRLTWSYEHEGKTLKIEMQAPAVAAHRYTYDKTKAEDPSLTNVGVIELYCETEGCTHAVLVDLPKIELGVNATQTNETDEYIVVDYVYETKYNCTVVLNILIYK